MTALLAGCEIEVTIVPIETLDDCLGFGGQQRWVDGDGDGYGDCWDADAGRCVADEIWCCAFAGGKPDEVDAADPRLCDATESLLKEPGDCDDSDAAVYPSAAESACDPVDSNCDGDTTDGDVPSWHYDGDQDGYGSDAADTVSQCEQPAGYVASDGDCEDADAAVNPGATETCNGIDDDCDGNVDDEGTPTAWYTDADGDGYGDTESVVYACEDPGGASELDGDCDDGNAEVHPGADESDCTDPVDYNCDGSVGYADLDLDGWAACEDCDDNVPTTSPSAIEYCDGIDNDCDGSTDEADASDASTWYADADGDTYGDPSDTAVACDAPPGYLGDASDCDDSAAAVNPAATEVCDGVDNDCDGSTDEADASDASTWYADADGDTYGDAADTAVACDAPPGYLGDASDCDDDDASVNPAATEVCDDIDNDCDGLADDDDPEGASGGTTWWPDGDEDEYSWAEFYDYSARRDFCDDPGAGWVGHAGSQDCDDSDPSVNPGATEVCDGVDNDCDGSTDEADASDASTWYADADGDTYGDATDTAVGCDAPAGYLADASDCDDGDASVNPAASEVCDGIDNDCDGFVDDDDPEGASGGTTWWPDDDDDGYSWAEFYDYAARRDFCDDPGAGWVDSAGSQDCDDSDPSINPGATEVCDGVDNDCDGEADDPSTCADGMWALYTGSGSSSGGSAGPALADFPSTYSATVADGTTLYNESGRSGLLLGFRTWAYADASTTWSVSISGDDDVSLYVDDAYVAGRAGSGGGWASGSVTVAEGWHEVEAVVADGGGRVELYVTPTASTTFVAITSTEP